MLAKTRDACKSATENVLSRGAGEEGDPTQLG